MIASTLPAPDQLEIAVRCYADNGQKPWVAKPATPAADYTLVFDCETTTDETQALRFGAYQFRQGQNLLEAGLFYDPEALSAPEAKLIEAHAAQLGLRCRTVSTFVDEVIYGLAYELGARIAGFNLPFDISRLAKDAGSARGAFRGGFTFRLSDDKRRPNVQIKSIDSRMALIQFAAPFRQKTPRGMRKRGVWTRVERGAFIDVRSLASAMLSGSFSLESLSKLLNVECQKEEVEAHGGTITVEYLSYCLKDVETTWQCLVTLEASYNALELDVPINQIYSEASIGKASLAAMGIVPWRNLQPDFPKELLGKFVSTYYGGRSEVHIRRQIARVAYCDFLSMYPTVCTKMDLWRFVIASRLEWRDGTQEIRDFLQSVTAEEFKLPDIWRMLPAIVRVKPNADLFPVRADYSGDGGRTIGLNYLTSREPLYFTLADCVAAKLLTGKTPEIEEAKPSTWQHYIETIQLSARYCYQSMSCRAETHLTFCLASKRFLSSIQQ